MGSKAKTIAKIISKKFAFQFKVGDIWRGFKTKYYETEISITKRIINLNVEKR